MRPSRQARQLRIKYTSDDGAFPKVDVDSFGRNSEKEARRTLAQRGVLVTNQGDKIVSFAKMRRLGAQVKMLKGGQ